MAVLITRIHKYSIFIKTSHPSNYRILYAELSSANFGDIRPEGFEDLVILFFHR